MYAPHPLRRTESHAAKNTEFLSSILVMSWKHRLRSWSVGHKPAELGKWRPSRVEWSHTLQVVQQDVGKIRPTVLHRVLCIPLSSLVTLKWKNKKKKSCLINVKRCLFCVCSNKVTKFSRSTIAAFSRQIHSLPFAKGQKGSCVVLKGSWCRKVVLIKVNACKRH